MVQRTIGQLGKRAFLRITWPGGLYFPRKNGHVILGFFAVLSKESGDSVPPESPRIFRFGLAPAGTRLRPAGCRDGGPYGYRIKTRLKWWVSRSVKMRRIFAKRGLVFFVGLVHLSPKRRWYGAGQKAWLAP